MLATTLFGFGGQTYVLERAARGAFPIVQRGQAAEIVVDPNDDWGVRRVAKDLAGDVRRVTGIETGVTEDADVTGAKPVVIVGTLGSSRLLNRLAAAGKVDLGHLKGKWESFVIQTVAHPFPGVPSALVIAGSDRRGAIYGAYDVSEEIGVSPWYWFADVPTRHRDELFVKAGRYVQGPPAVKYRGIFINDEAPALSNWVHANFRDYLHPFYEHVFELLLRLKANYMWPAMWNNAFSEDDPLNPKLADAYGIVMGTSHVEPMMRADKEWNRAGHTEAQWNYEKQPELLRKFWTEGVVRNKPYENIVTMAMRGKVDTPMSEGENISLLERIVADQRKILAEQGLADTPQLWALYKEVQGYYDHGMRVPDDITLLWADDNWGDIRRLPSPEEEGRTGGAGVYYHFDYVGGPRNYKWIHSSPLPKVWEQMSQALAHHADRIWIVNVGGLKLKEFPLEFFLRFAWDPSRWPKERLGEYARLWAERQFGADNARRIGDILAEYGRLSGRRKPELLEPATYSLLDYQEAETVLATYHALVARTDAVKASLPPDTHDAFFELVEFPVKASANLVELYVAATRNQLYARQGRASANAWGDRVRSLFANDAELSKYYATEVAGGRWNHITDQTHIGYTTWQQPDRNNMPRIARVDPSDQPAVGVAVEGSDLAWPGAGGTPSLPAFEPRGAQSRWIEVFNRGTGAGGFSVESEPWIHVSRSQLPFGDERLNVSIDWAAVPNGRSLGTVKITPTNQPAAPSTVAVPVDKRTPDAGFRGFVGADGYVAIEAARFTRRTGSDGATWQELPGYGRTVSAMTPLPMKAPSSLPSRTSPKLEYAMWLWEPGEVKVDAVLGPSLAFQPGRGLRYAVSFDDQPPQVVDGSVAYLSRAWEESVKDSVIHSTTAHRVTGTGRHVLKIWMVDPGVVLERVVVNLGGVRPSYLGPPESCKQ